jgi:hypothetical protein
MIVMIWRSRCSLNLAIVAIVLGYGCIYDERAFVWIGYRPDSNNLRKEIELPFRSPVTAFSICILAPMSIPRCQCALG